MKTIEQRQIKATRYYDRFSSVYNLLSSKKYYDEPRAYAIEQMQLKEGIRKGHCHKSVRRNVK